MKKLFYFCDDKFDENKKNAEKNQVSFSLHL